MKKTICIILILGFVGLISYSGYRIWLIQDDYNQETKIHDMVMEYKPDGIPGPEQQEDEIANQSIIDLQGKYPDVIGWLTVPNTKIDYPFVQFTDNDYYLRRDIGGGYALAGTVFMDYRCNKDFTSPNTIIYGHHMKNESMFGTLKSFNGKTFFDENEYGYIYLPRENLTLEFFAYMVVNPNDQEIYSTGLSDTYLDYVKQNARNYRDVGLTEADRIVTLSTCAYEFNNARMVLLARVV